MTEPTIASGDGPTKRRKRKGNTPKDESRYNMTILTLCEHTGDTMYSQ